MSIEPEAAAVEDLDVLIKVATMMAARRTTKTEIVAYLTKHGVSDTEAGQVSTQVLMEMTAARAQFDASKKKAMNSAMIRIGLGGIVLIIGFALLASGTETSGRRSPLGAFIGGAIVMASGFKELSDLKSQSFEKRIREVYR